MKNNLENISILIPSLDPDENLPIYVDELVKLDFKHIVLVDDGSDISNKHIFNEIVDKYPQVVLLTHEVNKGKGRALKTGIKYILDNMPQVVGIVTADADGQHSPKDTLKCSNRLLETNKIIFGTRNFNEEIVPFKSRNGNKITTVVFKLLYGKTINDTQTGLRGLPKEFAEKCLDIPGERFEYEIGMLIEAVRDGYEIVEEPIDTIYINSNRATHFNTFKDSYKIYKIMFSEFFKFIISGLSSSLIDFIVYSLLIKLVFKPDIYSRGILISTVIARIISSIYNFTMNKNKVFKSNESTSKSLVKYYILAVAVMLVSSGLVTFIYKITNAETIVIKVVVDTVLFFINYRLQRKYIF